MVFRRRFKRKRSGLRWFTPNVWSPAVPLSTSGPTGVGVPTFDSVGSATDRDLAALGTCPLIRGGAPLQPQVNAAGRDTGFVLQTRTYWKVMRIVGRLGWTFNWFTADTPLTRPAYISIHWVIARLKVDEQGVPSLPDTLRSRDIQDEKFMILAQDVLHQEWDGRTLPGSEFQASGVYRVMQPPMYDMVDLKLNRWIANEQDLYLLWDASFFSPGADLPTSGFSASVTPWVNLRTLGRTGR